MRLLLLLLCLQPALLSAAPRVVASVVPVFELTSAVMDGVGSPQLVIDGHASAHHFAFKPSHMKMLQQADLVIWIDEHFEAGFGRIDDILPQSTARLELLPALDAGGDGHFWYSPTQLRAATALIADALAQLDPDNRARYHASAESLSLSIEDWHSRFASRWRETPMRLLTDHAYLGSLANEFTQFDIRSVHDQHDDHGGLGEIFQVEDWVRAAPVDCLLTLETSPPALAASLADKYDLRIVSIAETEATESDVQATIRRLENLGKALEDCSGARARGD